jgi:hypothetical protein
VKGHRIMRRLFSVFAVLLSLSLLGPATTAQEATPGTDALADLGLPTLDVTVTADAYEGIPESIEAGRYLVTVSVTGDAAEFGGGIAFLQPPADMTAEAFMSAFMAPPDATGVGAVAATPIEGADASPSASDGQMGGPPEFLFEATYAGGTYSFGGPSQVVLDLTPGEWIAWADDPEAPQQPVFFEVTGEMPSDLPEPQAGATIIMGEYVIEVAEGELTSGPQVIRIDNIGAQPHFIGWFQLPDGTTAEQVRQVLDEEMQAEMTGTPPAYSDLNPEEDLMPVTFTATQSTNTSMWITVDLQAGTHGLICFFPDLSDGMPHSYHGMYNVIEVAD